MKTIFDTSTREDLIHRISKIKGDSEAVWGKMNLCQMMIHCIKWEEMALGKKKYKQSLLGRIFGKMALKDFVKDETPFKRNVPTVPEFKIKEQAGNIDELKEKWISLMKEYEQFTNNHFMHPFFGELTKEQTGILAYKHTDHHLRQFNT